MSQLIKDQGSKLEQMEDVILKKDLVIEGQMIKDVNLKVMGKKVRQMEHFYSQIIERMSHKHEEEAILYEKQIGFLNKKLYEFNALP